MYTQIDFEESFQKIHRNEEVNAAVPKRRQMK